MEHRDGAPKTKPNGTVSTVIHAVHGSVEPVRHEAEAVWDTTTDEDWVREVSRWKWEVTLPDNIPENGKATASSLLILTGGCPRCHHPMAARVKASKNGKGFVIACNCLGKHEGRPSDVLRGCGQAAVFKHPRTNELVGPAQKLLVDPADFVAATAQQPGVAWDTTTDECWIQQVGRWMWEPTDPLEIPELFASSLVKLENLVEHWKWTDRNTWTNWKLSNTAVLTVQGQCPRCGHPMSDREGALTDAEQAEVQNGSKPLPEIVIACNCLGKHEGRPDDVLRGCGRAAVFNHPLKAKYHLVLDNFERQRLGVKNLESARQQRTRADPDDLVWEQERQAARMEALKRTQATAEKWTATISALTGLFGLTAIITGGESIAKIRDTSGLLFGILVFCTIVALIAAAASIYLGAVAAQGVPHAPDIDGHTYRLVAIADALKAGVQLKWSRRTAIVAVVALGLGVGVLLYGQPSTKPNNTYLKVQLSDGNVLCADVQTLAGWRLDSGGTSSIGIQSLALATECQSSTAPAQTPSP